MLQGKTRASGPRGSLGGALRRLRGNRRGSAIAMMAAGLIPAIAALGSAIDAGRIYIVKSQLQTGVDAAALAGARAFSVSGTASNSRESQVAAYFSGNFPDTYMGVTNLKVAPAFTVIKDINTTTVVATATLPMSFMRLFGFMQQPVRATARAAINPHPLEVMMVLDNTGSLKANLPRDSNGVVKTRITALKDAAKSFNEILFQGSDTRKDLAMGYVMYDITVNVGKLLTDWRSSSVRQMFGFNDVVANTYGGTWPSNKLGWKGCVFGDDTVKDLTATLTYRDLNAWDIDRTLPGEGAHPPVKPYFIPPMYVPQMPGNAVATGAKANPSSAYYSVANVEPNNNLYKLHPSYYDQMLNLDFYGNQFANNPYREAFYDAYIDLNDNAAKADNDVIVRADNGGFYDPSSNPWNFTTRTGTQFRVRYDRIPQFNNWKDATEYTVNPLGGSVDDGARNKTEFPSPNWQCPEAATKVDYGRSRSFYDDVIDRQNAAIYPANGTLHHAGLLWGYRLLVRDDVFKRTPPRGQEEPKRALVFMTDGETALGTSQNGYDDRTWTFYGNYADSPISSSRGGLIGQSERRFAKTCAALQAEDNAPKVYIVALTTTDRNTLAMFEQCAPGHVYQTSDTATLKAAFDDIASELVDLHLVQ